MAPAWFARWCRSRSHQSLRVRPWLEGLEPRVVPVAFVSGQAFPTFGLPFSVEVADLNGDGHDDIVAGSMSGSVQVSVLLGNGDGTFKPALNFASGPIPSAMALADINGDGKPDLVFTDTYTGMINVFLGNGNGTFQASQNFPFLTGKHQLIVADVSGDGHPDLITTNTSFNSVSVLLGNGNGNFKPAQNFSVGVMPLGIAWADFNGDNHPDLVVAGGPGSGSFLLLGSGDGTFAPPQSLGPKSYGVSVATADVNGDGHPDIILGVFAGNVQVLLGNGNGTFQAPNNYVSYSGGQVAVADLNNDNLPDIVTVGSQGATVLLGAGGGAFVEGQSFNPGSNPQALALGDVNGDGRPDLITGNGTPFVVVQLGNGDGTFLANEIVPTGEASFLAQADMNGDGQADLVVSGTGTLQVLLGNGDGTFQAPKTVSNNFNIGDVAVADMNGDGKPDLVISDGRYSPVISVFLGNGDGTFQAPLNFTLGGNTGKVVLADVNGDGLPDIEVTTGNVISVLLNRSGGTFSAALTTPPLFSTPPMDFTFADFNQDGRPDLVVVGLGNVGFNGKFLLGNGDGTFKAPVNFSTEVYSPNSVAVGDFNQDGIPDLVVDDPFAFSSDLQVFLGNGDGTFQPYRNFAINQGPGSIVVADLNGDGRQDLVSGTGSNIVSVLYGNGDGTFQPERSYPTFGYSNAEVVADFNDDGRPDIASAYPNGHAVTFLFGAPAAGFRFSGPHHVQAGTSISLAVTAIGSDGLLDHNFTGTVSLSSSDPLFVPPAPYTFTAADKGHHSFTLTLKSAGQQTITASSSTLQGQQSVTVDPGLADHLAFGALPASVAAGQSFNPVVTVRVVDAFGNVVTGDSSSVTLALGSNPGGSTLSGTLTQPAVNGVATFPDLSLNKPAAGYSLTASDGSLTGVTSSVFTVLPGAPSRLVFFQEPASTAAGQSLGQVLVEILDSAGNLVTTDSSSVTLSLGSGPGGASLHGTTTRVFQNGQALFNDLSITTAGTGYTLFARDGSLPVATSLAFSISPGPASQLGFGQQPGTATAGQVLSPAVTVEIEDAFGNLVPTASTLVTLALGSNPGGDSLAGTLARAALNGVATFDDLSLTKAASGYTLSASASGLSAGVSATFAVTPAAPSRLAFSAQPGPVTAGQPFAVSVQVLDPFGNLFTLPGVTVFLSLASGGASLGGPASASVVGGVATFNGLTLDRAASGYSLTAAAGSLSTTSSAFSVSPGDPSRLVPSGFPSATTAGLAQGFTVTVVDAFGNTVTGFVGTVSFASSDPQAGLPAPYPFTAADAGVHTFSATLKTAGMQTLTVNGPGSIVGSLGATVTAAALARLAVTAPATAFTGEPFSLTVTAQDAFGNAVPSYTGTVRFSSTDTAAGTALPPAYTFTATDQGSHTFTGLVTLKTPGSQTVTATDAADARTATSGPIAVSNQSDDALFLAGLYHDLLGRTSDPAGLAYFQPPLDAARAAALDQVATQVLASGEYKTDLAGSFLARLLPADAHDSGYVSFFGSELQSMTDEAVLAQMAGSGEYFQDQGGTNLGWLQALYPALLGRPLDSAGQSYFGGLLASGVSRQAVAAQILASPEYRTDLVQADAQQFLGHAASAAGVSYFLGLLQAGQTDEQVAEQFLQSDEFFRRQGDTSSTWLAGLYPALLGRSLDAAGQSYFGGLLYADFAGQRQAVVTQFLHSREYEGDLVNGCYEKYLSHGVSPSDLTGYWYGQLDDGQSYEQVQSQILGSAEYFASNGSNNLTWLQQVYVQVLNRPLDQAGLSYFGGLLGGGASRQQVALTILRSGEYQADLVQSVYQTYLGRAAGSADVGFWQGQLQAGLTTAAFIQDVLASQEYYQRSHPYP